ncbi:hypothetical protein RCL1_004306 [Eukaryota sp. TZLM3-RCL]
MKILCLHGYRSDAKSFRIRTGSVRKVFKKYAELLYVNATIPLVDPSVSCFGYWTRSDDDTFLGLEQSVLSVISELRSYNEKGTPVKGLLGFSQGAVVAAIVAGLSSAPVNTPAANYWESVASDVPRLEAVLIFSGFVPLFNTFVDSSNLFTLALQYLFPISSPEVFERTCDGEVSTAISILTGGVVDTPTIPLISLHCYGQTDQQIPWQSSALLSKYFSRVNLIEHSGGHFVPSACKDDYARFFETVFLKLN